MKIIDSHCHLDLIAKNASLDTIIQEANDNQVVGMLNISLDLKSVNRVIEQTTLAPNIWASVGIHPCNCEPSDSPNIEDTLLPLTENQNVIAIGETGLDFFHQDKEDCLHQIEYFERHIQLAIQQRLPLIIHSRNSIRDVIEVLKSNHADQCGGIIHCFTEDWSMAKQVLDLGFHISFSGILTYRKSHDLRSLSKKIPLNRLLVETDSPYLSPHPVRGKPNEPKNTKYTLECLAECLGKNPSDTADLTTENFCNLFAVEVI